ncbi:unnamed protein product [Durusdinium trenchii]|uniref:RanBP2-type domain-containing protein n=1 Tax=Durusdinium trenchii TaxID=1381693 RepID=A0ABP0MMB0_9DINO
MPCSPPDRSVPSARPLGGIQRSGRRSNGRSAELEFGKDKWEENGHWEDRGEDEENAWQRERDTVENEDEKSGASDWREDDEAHLARPTSPDPDKWKDEKDIPEDAEAWKGEADTPQGRGEEPPEPAEPPSKKQRRSSHTWSERDRDEGEWNCSLCKALNFAFRRKCFKCKAEKPRNEGDWICTLCSGLNSMHQRECFRCGEPTDEQDEPKKEAPAPLTLFSSDHPEDKAEEGEDAVEGEAAEGEEAAEEAEEEERSSPVPPKSPPPRMASPVRTSPPRFPPPQPKGPPPKHRANASRSPPRLPSAPPKGLAPQAKSGLPAKAAPRSGPPPRKERGLPKQTPKELPKAVPEEVMKEVAPQEAVKVFARLSPSFKKSWVQYCRMLRDTSDPSKLELEFIQQFLDYLGALIEADLPPQPSLPPLATKPKEATVSIRRSVVDCITKLNETGKLKKELRLEKVAQFLSKLEEEKGLQVLALLRKHMLQVADPNEFVRIQASLEQRRG